MLTVGGLFDGIGLLAYGLHCAGLEHAWLCEVDPFRRAVLERRWPGAHVYADVRAVGAAAGRVDIIAGGFPCKGASTAGSRNGFDHPETRLWHEMARAVGELRPRYVVVENVANILGLHNGAVWGTVLGDLAALGYDVEWDCLPAAAVGAPHRRDRVFAVAADPNGTGEGRGGDDWGFAHWWSDVAGGGLGAATDTEGEHRQTGPSEGASLGRAAGRGYAAPADAYEGRRDQQQVPDRAGEERQLRSGDDSQRRGLRVEWGPYGPAIRRWEALCGPAPEPLVRRMDDGRARWVERSRLSALGDGVQVQLGWLIGSYVAALDDRHHARKAAA